MKGKETPQQGARCVVAQEPKGTTKSIIIVSDFSFELKNENEIIFM